MGRNWFSPCAILGRAVRLAGLFRLGDDRNGITLSLDGRNDDEDITFCGCNGCAGIGSRAHCRRKRPTWRTCRWLPARHRMTAGRRSVLAADTKAPKRRRRACRPGPGRAAQRGGRPRCRTGPAKAVDPSRAVHTQGTGDPTVRLARTGRDLQLAQPHESMERAGLYQRPQQRV